jgi:GNAT superfamily N-acetyltransferase
MRHFTLEYVERAVLRDGSAVRLRLVTPEDKALLRDGFERLSPASRYARFLAPKDSLTDDELAYLTELDHEHHVALGAVREDDSRGFGIARFIRFTEEPLVAEAAVAVADEMHGRGLGRLLFLRLCAAAAERGVERFRCEVLGDNHGMAALIAGIAPDRTVAVESGVMTIDLTIPEVAPTVAVTDPPPDSAMYRVFRAAAENTLEWTDAVRRLWRR